MNDARSDLSRASRTGIPEVIFGSGKTPEQIERIARELIAANGFALATRVDPAVGSFLAQRLPDAAFDPIGRVLRSGRLAASGKRIGIVSAGTSDVPVASEAAAVLDAFGHDVDRWYDVGVAGVHRLLAVRDELERCAVLVVVAGMEGALPSVVAGLVHPPVVAVPTSVGYGAALEGVTALLAMMSSCAPGIAVVNIDSGFGAAALAHKIVASRDA